MSMNINVQGGSSVKLLTAGKYCEEDIVVTATGGAEEINWNLVLNKWGSEDYEFDSFFYTGTEIIGSYGKFAGLQANKLFLTNLTKIPASCFENSKIELVWLGSTDLNTPNNTVFALSDAAFFGSNELVSMVINSNLPPQEALNLFSDNLFFTSLYNSS